MEFEEIDLEGPKDGEVLIRIVTTSLCHTDVFTLSGEDPERLFPCILGHEGCGVVEEIGKGVTSVKPGDHIIPLYVPEDPECPYIKLGKTNLCQMIRATHGSGHLPDGRSSFSLKGKQILCYMGTSMFIGYTVLPQKFNCKNLKGRAALESVSYGLCGADRNWWRSQYGKSRTWFYCRSLRARSRQYGRHTGCRS